MAGLHTFALFVWLTVIYSTVNGMFNWNATIDITNVVIPLNESSVIVNCPTSNGAYSTVWFNATSDAMVATGNDYNITATGNYYCQVTERKGIYRSNTFTVYRTSFAENFTVDPKNFTVFGDTTRVAFECRINTFIATQDDASQLNIVWEASSNDNFTQFSTDGVFNPLPGYSILVIEYNETLPTMFRCQAVFTSIMGVAMVVATSEIAYINDTLGMGSGSGPPGNVTFLLRPSNEVITQTDTAAFVCVAANSSVEATWSSHPNSVNNTFYLIVTNVMENTTVSCSIDGESSNASITVQEVPAIMEDMVLAPMTAAREGTDITLSCLPEMTYPTPNITWLANGTDVQVPTANYTVGPINASSETIYQCLVEATFVPSTNSIGLPPSISFITTTVIDCVPVVMVMVVGAADINGDGAYDVRSGTSFSITCTLSCPTATVIWTQNGTVIGNSNGFSIANTTDGNGDITQSVLTRDMAGVGDTAAYQCGTTVQTIQSNDTADVFVYVDPEITQGPVDAARRLGESVNFTCVATGVPLPVITWSNNSNGNIPGQSSMVDDMTVQSQIMLSDLQLGDFGIYTCTATNSFNVARETALLQCVPDITVMVDGATDVNTDGAYDVRSGTSFNITCMLSCPTATVTWTQNGTVISNSNGFSIANTTDGNGDITQSVLTRDMAGVGDTATYQCGTTVQTIQSNGTADVFVYIVPNITQPPMDMARKEGESVNFTCVATGVPLPVITWSSDTNDNITAQSDDIIITNNTDGSNRISVLTLVNPKVEDFQNYTCNATNAFGNDNETALLGMKARILQGPVEVTQLLGLDVTFTCNATGIPIPIITWSSDNMADIIPSSFTRVDNTILSEILVANIGMEEFVNYTCTAMNLFDTVNASAPLVNATIPVITVPPQDAVVLLGGNVTFSCTAIGLPAPSITWSNEVNGTIPATDTVTMDTSTTSILMLTNLTVSYFNQSYTCTASNLHNMTNSSAFLTQGMMAMITEPPQNASQLEGRNVSFRCAAFGIPRPNITWMFAPANGMPMEPLNDGIIIDMDDRSIRVELNLTNITSGDFGAYYCVANNMFNNDTARALLEQGIKVMISTLPQDRSAAVAETVTFQCVATGNGRPSITWVRQDGMEFAGSQTILNTTTTESNLTITNVMSNDFTNYSCLAENTVADNIIETINKTDFANFTLYKAVAPNPPVNVMSGVVTSRTATISWLEGPLPNPVNPITDTYIVFLNGTQVNTTIKGQLTVTLTGLTPFTVYNVTVQARNRIEVSSMSQPLNFTTMEEAPGAPPQNFAGRSTVIGRIELSWSPPPSDKQFGMITGYSILYRINGSGEDFVGRNVSNLNTTITELRSNVAYSVKIAAINSAGISPFSTIVITTIPNPPDSANIVLPTSLPPSDDIGTTSIILTLPNSTVTFSHVWVVAVRLSSMESSVLRSNTSDYPNRTAFSSFSNALDDEPYIVAEISAANYPVTFALGDNSSTAQYSDFLELDYNGPLMEGRYYSIFVRFFSPSVPEVRAKRNTDNRQYSVFTTTGFLPAVATAVTQLADDSNTAAIVGGVIGGLVVPIIIIVTILVIVIFAYRRWDGELGPPPSRAGSKRFRDEDKPFHTEDTMELKAFEPNETRQPISVQEFENHVRARHKNSDNLFADEYELINIKSPRLNHEATSQAVNIAKNRYANINAYDQTRVRLMPYEGVDGSDYINANYVDGYKRKNAYVATQGPLPNTTEDFWRMVWEQESYTIVMLTNLMEKARVKCHQYWPQVGSVSYGNFTVTLIDSMEVANYCVRTLRLAKSTDGEKNDETREIKQFHYTSWPDFGVPEHPSPIITFMRRIAQNKPKLAGPIIIHCSAGVGRTGTLITIQCMLEMIIDTGTLDIFNFVLGLRKQRSFMVQTEKQYIFIHDTILEAIKVGNTQIEVINLRKKLNELSALDHETDQSGIEAEFSKLGELEQVDTSQFSAATAAYNQNKNRFPHILPYDKHRVKLLMYPGIEGSDYINATFLDGYHQRDQYILTQGPMQNTVGDFWRMIWEYKVSCVAMLCQLQEKGVDQDQSYKYWPELSQVLHFADILIETSSEKTMGGYIMREISITNSKVNESRTINQFQYLDWQEDRCPNTASNVIDMIGWLTKMQYHRGGGPVVIHDCASVGRSATFCALKIVVEQVKTEGIIDVFYTVHTMRTRQPLSVRQIGQYHYIYNAVAEFLDSFDHYANFNDYKAH